MAKIVRAPISTAYVGKPVFGPDEDIRSVQLPVGTRVYAFGHPVTTVGTTVRIPVAAPGYGEVLWIRPEDAQSVDHTVIATIVWGLAFLVGAFRR